MLNYSVRPLLWTHKKNAKGFCPVMICVTVARNRTYIKTPYKIKEDQWKDGEVVNHLNKAMYNGHIRKQIADLEKEIIAKQLEGIPVTLRSLKAEPGKNKLFSTYAKEVRDIARDINRVVNYAGEIMLTDINVTFLRKFEAHERARGLAPNTLNSVFKYVRRIINQAFKEKLIKENPFNSYTIPRYQQTDRVYLVQSEIDKLKKALPKLTGIYYNTLCYFLLGCYSGLRHSDWQRFNPNTMAVDGFLRIRAKKNKTHVVLPIGPTLADIIDRIREISAPASNQKCNEYLKAIAALDYVKIKKKLTCHTARHSFGYLCASNKLPRSVTAELLGVDSQTVNVYYHLSGEDIISQAAVLRTL